MPDASQLVIKEQNATNGSQDVLFRSVNAKPRQMQALVPPAHLREVGDLARAQACFPNAPVLSADCPFDADLIRRIDPGVLLTHGVVPVHQGANSILVATCRPNRWDAALPFLTAVFGRVDMALAPQEWVHAAIARTHHTRMATHAETWLPEDDSCHDINRVTPLRLLAALVGSGACLSALYLAPAIFFSVLVCIAVLTLVASQCLKAAAALATFLAPPPKPPPRLADKDLPFVSLMVPLLREKDIAGRLVRRLNRLNYPRDRLEALLILEHDDAQTRAVLAETDLPEWMQVIEVPPGSVRTKPRALNYAFRFSSGDVIGIFDAEDAPATDQLLMVADSFADKPPSVGCLQGILDYYNAGENWLSRCFAIEYATWFRVVLPGMTRLGLTIPLGGTTLFLRRAALETVRGWDAFNVTEDADLGIRLARHGYRTDVVPTVTLEEANNRLWPWIRQRSRWLKGYMATYVVHMRSPGRLWADLGPRRFFGVQVLLLGTVMQFLLAPVLWSFWLIFAALPHPVNHLVSDAFVAGLIALFLLSEAVSMVVAFFAVARTRHKRLLPWVPTMMGYFPFGVLAAYKGLWQMIMRPFFWDKTTHGMSRHDASSTAERPAE